MWNNISAWNALSRLRGLPRPTVVTTPPGRYVLLFDGLCRFCQAQVKNLIALAKPGVIETVDFQQPGVLDQFPGLTHDECMRAMQLIAPDGRIFQGFEAAARAVTTRPLVGLPAYLYYLPGVRLSCDTAYALVAHYRYLILGKVVEAGGCEGATCSLHFKPKPAGNSSR